MALKSPHLLYLDGGMGTMLQAAGMPPGCPPEQFCLANPHVLRRIHGGYLAAGANIITTCTFGASKFKLPPDLNVFEVNRDLAAMAREAIAASGREGPLFVAGDVGPTGLFAKPLGGIEPIELVEAFQEQIRGLAAGGADVIFMETQFDLAEARLAIAAARQVCDLPVMVSMTFEHGVSLTGTTPEIFAATAQNLDVDALGTNCSLGPVEMLPVVETLLKSSQVPVLVEPNAGLPVLRGSETVFPLGPEEFAQKTAVYAEMGARILGGCCGTTPAHMEALVKATSGIHSKASVAAPWSGICLTSRSSLVRIGADSPIQIIGERINPTGKPKLAAELADGEFGEALRLAAEQIEAGAAVLDVNVGAPLVNETEILPALTCELVARHLVPLSLDSPNAAAIAKAIPYCPGSCLVNSISGEEGRLEILGPLCRDYGAPFILLPILGTRLPHTAKERIIIIEEMLARAHAIGLDRRLALVDILALSVSADDSAARECMKVAAWCRENGLATTIGLSNISFGLPARELLNSVFLAMAAGSGLNACIANPGSMRIREAVSAINVLQGTDPGATGFIDGFSQWKAGNSAIADGKKSRPVETLYDAVLAGDTDSAGALVDAELKKGIEPFRIVNEILIPAITEVGARYERREYFLPQLIRSAETMQSCFARLKPLLAAMGGGEKKPVIVMATVEGDIHDIGKNIVCLLLGNHGFEVIDAGKDVPASEIVDCAMRHNAVMIGLSALMTTTMVRMEDTIRLVREKNLPIKILVGGAAVTREFAESIGADAYCEDAVSGVRAATSIMSQLEKASSIG